MAHYVRYEIYLPVRYRDLKSGETRSLEPSDYYDFLQELLRKYRGYTHSNPVGPPPYRGYWESEGEVYVDELLYLMVLVKSSDLDASLADFTSWKTELEKRYDQKLVLIAYFPLQIIGELQSCCYMRWTYALVFSWELPPHLVFPTELARGKLHYPSQPP